MKSLLLILLIGSLVLSGCLSDSKQIQLNDHEERITDLEEEVFAEPFSYSWNYSHGFNETPGSVHAKYLFEVTNNYSEPILLEKGSWVHGADGENLFDYTGEFCLLENLPKRVDSGETVSAEVDCFAWCSLDDRVPHMFSISFRFRDSNVLVQKADWTGELESSFELNLVEFRDSYYKECGYK